jgi:electron transfer flavoprotein beta subunit
MLAEILELPHALGVSTLELGDGTFTAKREIEGGTEVLEGSLPAVITAEKGLNEPRYPALKGIMAAKKKPLDTKSPEDLGLDAADLLEQGRVVWESMELPEPRAAGKILDGEPAEAVAELVRALREESKVI